MENYLAMRKVRLGIVTLFATVMLVAPAASPAYQAPVLVATIGGFAPAVITVEPNQALTFRSTDIVHSFSTAVGLCDSGEEFPGACDVEVGPLGQSTIRIHENAPVGAVYNFHCKFHHVWMTGKVIVQAPGSGPTG